MAEHTKEIHQYINAHIESVTLQAIHRIVKKLIDQSILTKQQKKLFVSQEWIVRIQNLLPQQNVFTINPGESFKWVFKSLSNLDSFWKHVTLQLFKDHPNEPVFLSSTHAIWPYTHQRQQSEYDFYQYFEDKTHQTYYAAKYNHPFDIQTSKTLKNKYTQFSLGNTSIPATHLTVINNIVADTRLKKSDEEKIDAIYTKNKNNHTQLEEELRIFLKNVKRATLIVEHNQAKAQKLRKKIAKDFYIPQEDIEKFNLW